LTFHAADARARRLEDLPSTPPSTRYPRTIAEWDAYV
jgi:hypothetical protein